MQTAADVLAFEDACWALHDTYLCTKRGEFRKVSFNPPGGVWLNQYLGGAWSNGTETVTGAYLVAAGL